jgi:hypothetical protein
MGGPELSDLRGVRDSDTPVAATVAEPGKAPTQEPGGLSVLTCIRLVRDSSRIQLIAQIDLVLLAERLELSDLHLSTVLTGGEELLACFDERLALYDHNHSLVYWIEISLKRLRRIHLVAALGVKNPVSHECLCLPGVLGIMNSHMDVLLGRLNRR